jgi:hypothetical protein
LTERLWPAPQHPAIGSFSDLTLYGDALNCARGPEGITAALLHNVLAPRLRSSRHVERPGLRTVRSLLEELEAFGWLKSTTALPAPRYTLTSEGEAALVIARRADRAFLRLLATRLHAVYTIPGWFGARLWTINPQGGEVILPSPAPAWKASAAARANNAWGSEQEQETIASARRAQDANAAAFPVSTPEWIAAVSEAWKHVLTRRRRRQTEDDPLPWTRGGLTLAMRIAALRLLFGGTAYGRASPDILVPQPLSVKTLKPWCPRLQALELIAYTDWHPSVTGRLLFPTAVFRSEADSSFEELPAICHPDGRRLFLHQPSWPAVRERFWATLADVYRQMSQRTGLRYVSLFDVRDEVCRRLRLSSSLFERCLAHALEEPLPAAGWRISVETDVREEMRSGGQRERRPISVGGVPYTIIAVAKLPAAQGRTT